MIYVYLVLKCLSSAQFYVTADLIESNDATNATGINSPNTFISCVKESRESKRPGTVTYLQDNKVYRASVTDDGRIDKSPIMAFGASITTTDFQDIIVHDDYILVRM